MADKLKSYFSTPVGKILEKHSALLASVCFLFLASANAFFSYGSLSLNLKIWVGLLGFIAPLFLAFFLLKGKDPFKFEAFRSPPPWLWVVLITLAAFLRLFHLTTVSPWPVADEGLFGYFATLQGEKWDWRVFHDLRTTPLVYSWGLSFFFKAFGQSLSTLWLFSALCSIACVPLIGMACRKTFPFSTAFYAFCWMALGFWPLYMGRFSTQCILLVLWECLTFLALARYLSAPQKSSPNKNIFWLALLTGTGFYTYLAWPFVALMVGLTLLFNRSQVFVQRVRTILKFMFIVILCCVPLIFQFAGQYHGYFHHLWAFGAQHDLMDRLSLPLSCFRDFFWGAPQKFFHFGPVWGGFLNPLLTSFFFFALVNLFHSFRNPRSLWILAAFLVFFLPALLTNNFEIMRLTPMLPLLTLICAVGTQSFLSFFPAKKRALVFFLALLASAAFDLNHLFFVFPGDWEKRISYYEGARSPEFHRAYSRLNPVAAREGPGLILLNFLPDAFDQTLFVATYSFNAAENPRLNPANARWAAILTNIHEQPYLKKIFPKGQWVWLSGGLNRLDGGAILEIVPLTNRTQGILNRWTQADQSLKELTRMIVELGVNTEQRPMLAVLEKAYPYFKGDPLLETRYWRIMSLHHAAEGKVAEAAMDDKKGIEKGLPMAHLYNEMGCLLFKEKNLEGARKAFEGALRLKLNLTNADSNLWNLLLLKKAAQ